MEKTLQDRIDRDKIHEETGIEDNGPKPTKISAVVRAQRLWDRIDLIENHLIKDLEAKIDKIETALSKDLNRLEGKICELSTYNAESQAIFRRQESILKVIVMTLKIAGYLTVDEVSPGLPDVPSEPGMSN